MNRLMARLATALLVLGAGPACSDDPVTPPADSVAEIVITPPGPHTIEVNGTLPLTGSARNASGGAMSGVSLTWTSSNDAVARVAGGVVTGVAVGGPVTITARSGSVRAEVQVTVEGEATSYLHVSPQAGSLTPGSSLPLTVVRVTDGSEAPATGVTWSSSNGEVATIDAQGVITAQAPGGPVLIQATTGGLTGYAMVHVLDPIANLHVFPSDAVLLPGQSLTFVAGYSDEPTPFNRLHTNPATVWTTSDPGVATVDASTGRVTVVGTGEATVTATLAGVSASSRVIGSEGIEPMLVGGFNGSCGLTEAGAAYCWGGMGSMSGTGIYESYTVGRSLPLEGGHVFRTISMYRDVCGVTTIGELYCTTHGYGPPFVGRQMSRIDVPAPVKSVAVGVDHTLALTESGDVYAWGRNDRGQLGIGSVDEGVLAPTRVDTPHEFVAIAAGNQRSVALRADGRAFEWGGRFEPTAEGVYYTTSPDSIHTDLLFDEIATTGSQTVALTVDGVAYQWGIAGMTTGHQATPVAVATGERFTAISMGQTTDTDPHVLALTADGRLFGWGASAAGQVAAGAEYHGAPVRIGTQTFTHIAAGWMHSLALSDGVAWGWGLNASGELGIDTIGGAFDTPQRAAEPAVELWVGFSDPTLVPGRSDPVVGDLWNNGVAWVRRVGGFNTTTGGHDEPLFLRLEDAPVGVAFDPWLDALIGPTASSNLRIRAAKHTTSGSYPLTFSLAGAGVDPAAAEVTVTVSGGSSGGGATPGNLDLVCESASTSLPAGYHCMANSAGQLVPGMFSHAAMHGTWVDEGAEVCITWNADGSGTGRYKPAQLGGSAPIVSGPEKWGVIVRRDGTPEGSATAWYVFSGALEPQTQLLTFDSTTNTIPGWGFEKKACPW